VLQRKTKHVPVSRLTTGDAPARRPDTYALRTLTQRGPIAPVRLPTPGIGATMTVGPVLQPRRRKVGFVLLVGLAAIVLVILGIVIKGLGYLLVAGLIAFVVTLIVAAANYLRTGWRR
jgi:hypothetical protein